MKSKTAVLVKGSGFFVCYVQGDRVGRIFDDLLYPVCKIYLFSARGIIDVKLNART